MRVNSQARLPVAPKLDEGSPEVTPALRTGATKKGKGSPYSITERRVSELIPVLGSQPAGDVTHKPGGRLPLLSAMPAVTLATLNEGCYQFCCLVRWV